MRASQQLKVFFRGVYGVLFLLSIAGLHGCSSDEGSSVSNIIKIGQVSPLTGNIAHLGKDNENGARLALEEANEKNIIIGGLPVTFELVSEDDEAKPAKSTIVAQKLVDAGVVGVVGHLNSGTTIPASKIYFDAGIAQVSPSATNVNYTNQGYNTAFRVIANDSQQGRVLGNYAVKLGAKTIGVIDDRTDYGKGLAEEFEKAAKAAGAEIVTHEFTDNTKTDFTAILTRIKSMSADLIFFSGMDAQAGPMMKQIKNLGIEALFLTGDGGQTEQFLTLAGEAAEGAYASSPGEPLEKMQGGRDFEKKYMDSFNQPIQIYAPYAYDAMGALIAAMIAADSSDPKVYLPALAEIEHVGVTGPVAFDDKGDIQRGTISLYQVTDGKWKYLETLE